MKRVLNWVEMALVSPVLLYRYIRFRKIFRRIYLGENKWTILEPADYRRLKGFKWFIHGNQGKFYAHRNKIIKNERTKTISMHREITNAPKGKLVDHRNGDPKDNRRENLRLATFAENVRNRSKWRSKTTSKYLGVYREKDRRRWAAQIRHKKLGRFDNEIEAAKAYDREAKKLYGEFARLNFPE